MELKATARLVIGRAAALKSPAPPPARSRGNMTLRRLAPIVAQVSMPGANWKTVMRASVALDQRERERGSSKLGRRLGRKRVLGRLGSF